MVEKSTRDHLIDVGVGLMHRHGYNATGLKEILEAAGVPKGSFYHHFASKEEFAVATLNRYVCQEAEHAETVLNDSSISPMKRLKRYFTDLIRIYGQKGPIPGCMMGRFSFEIAAESDLLRKHLSTSFREWQSAIASVIHLAVEQKELPPETDAQALSGFLLNSWQGALVRSQAEKSDAPLKTFMHYSFEVLMKG